MLDARPDDVCGIVSEYVTKKLSKKVSDKFIAEAKIIYTDNPVCQGWIFELFFLKQILASHSNSSRFQLLGENGLDFGFIVRATKKYIKGSIFRIDNILNGTVFIPSSWNQGCFDAVYYEKCIKKQVCRRKFTFFNATLAGIHNYNFQFIANFLCSFFGQGKFDSIDVIMAAVTSTKLFDDHNANEGYRTNISSVHTFDPNFQGNVIKYHIKY